MNTITLIDYEHDYTDRLMNAITLIDWWTRLHWSTNERDYTDRLMNAITLID